MVQTEGLAVAVLLVLPAGLEALVVAIIARPQAIAVAAHPAARIGDVRQHAQRAQEYVVLNGPAVVDGNIALARSRSVAQATVRQDCHARFHAFTTVAFGSTTDPMELRVSTISEAASASAV